MATKGLLLMNLGSPASPSWNPVRRYLSEFLNDPHVLDVSPAWRLFLSHALIAPTRAGKSAAAYRKVWTPAGSPLLEFSRQFAKSVQETLGPEEDPYAIRFAVKLAMRYGQPRVADQLRDWSIDELYVVPLYPQYAQSSTLTALHHVQREAKRLGFTKPIYALDDFHAAPEYLVSQSEQIALAIERFHPDHVLLSFHGLPEHHMTKMYPEHCLKREDCCVRVTGVNSHCYRAQCYATARGLKLNWPNEKISVSFQSRLGRRPWIKPYTDHVVNELAARGVKRLLVSCPSFVADCLETLEEVQMRLREQFIAAGGEELQLVPALNAERHWVINFTRMIRRPGLPWRRLE